MNKIIGLFVIFVVITVNSVSLYATENTKDYLTKKEVKKIKESNESYHAYQKMNEYNVFLMLIKSSKYIKSWSIHTDLKHFHLWEEDTSNGVISAMVYIDREGRSIPENEPSSLGVIAHFDYNIKTKKLINSTTGDRVEEKFDKVWVDIMDIYLFDKKREYLFLKKKTFLYKASNLNSKSKKFLIKNDCALIIDKTKDGWYKVFYYHPHWHSNVILWIKFDAEKHGLIR